MSETAATSETAAVVRPVQTAYTPCAYEGCVRAPVDGVALFRVNPYGEIGIFMCAEHAREVDAPPREPR